MFFLFSGNQIKRVAPKVARLQGVTLIECVVVLAIMSILLTASMPSLSAMLQRKRVEHTVLVWMQAAEHARHMAWTSHRPIILAPRGVAGWVAGWQVSDEATGKILRVYDAPPAGVRLESTAYRFRFVPTDIGVSTAGNILIRAWPRARVDYQGSVIVSFTGKIRRDFSFAYAG